MDYYEDFKAKMLSDVLPRLPRYCQYCGDRRTTMVDYDKDAAIEKVRVKIRCNKCEMPFLDVSVVAPEDLLDDKFETLK